MLCFTVAVVMPLLTSAQSKIDSINHRLVAAQKLSEKFGAYIDILKYYANRNQDSLKHYTEEALAYVRAGHFRSEEGQLLGELAIIDKMLGRIKLAKYHNNQALEIQKELGNLTDVANLLSNNGAIEASTGNYEEAAKYFLEAARINDTLKNEHGQLLCYMNLGSLYFQINDLANAEVYLKRALTYSEKEPTSASTAGLYNMLGIYYASKNKADSTLSYFTRALKICQQGKFVNAEVECLLYLGQYYLDAGDVDRGIGYLKQGLHITEERQMPELRSNILLQLAMLVKDKDPQQALLRLKEALSIASSMDNRYFMEEVYQAIAQVNKENKHFEEALLATESAQKIHDSLYSVNKAVELSNLSSTYELEQSTQKLNELAAEGRRHIAQRNAVIIVALAVALLLLVLYIYYRKTVQLNRRLHEQEARLREINTMKDKLFSIIGHDLKGPVASVATILDIYEDPATSIEEKQFLLASLREHGKASLDMLDKLLFWGQSLVKGIKMQPQAALVNNYVRQNLELKKVKLNIKKLTVDNQIPDGTKVTADPIHLDFIIRNFLSNAIKYSYTGQNIEFFIDTTIRKGFVTIAVRDHGVGISETDLSSIFTPLSSKLGTENEKGNGIGLMLCREFALLNGGDIWVESKQGEGATFYLALKEAK